MPRLMRPVLVAESVTELGDVVRGAVLVAGSHGGLIASCLGATAGAYALILNDAGVGLDQAGIAGMAYLDGIGMAAATVAHTGARIGDGRSMWATGLLSHINQLAKACGAQAGMSVRDVVVALIQADTAALANTSATITSVQA